MVTEGVELLVKLEDLHKEYDIVVLKTKDPSKTTQTKLDRINKNISKPWQTLFQAAKTPCLEVQEKALRQKVSSGMKMVDNAMKELNRFGSRVPVEAHLQPNKSAGPNKNEVKGKGGARGQGKKGKKGRRTWFWQYVFLLFLPHKRLHFITSLSTSLILFYVAQVKGRVL